MFAYVAVYLVAINVLTFAAFSADKRAAERGAWRTPERRLLALAAIGGSPAALAAQQLLRHKTRKQPFGALLWTVVMTHFALLAALAYLAR